MKLRRWLSGCCAAGVLVLGTSRGGGGQAPDLESILRPGLASEPSAPVPLRPPEPRRMPVVASAETRVLKPPFVLSSGDRVVFLGDQLLRGELETGYLETRLTTHYPQADVTFRNLSWITNHPFGPTLAGNAAVSGGAWLARLMQRLREAEPTVVLVGFGTEASFAGAVGVEAFRKNLDALLDRLGELHPNLLTRSVLFTPLGGEEGLLNREEAARRRQEVQLYAQVVSGIASNRACEVVDLARWLPREARLLQGEGKAAGQPVRYLTEDGTRLTPFGYSRLPLALIEGLRWQPNVWRFGYQRDGAMRAGQLGIETLSHSRSSTQAVVQAREERLPPPNLPGFIDLNPASRPQCFIQVAGLDPGTYALAIDGEDVVRGTEAEWGQYEIISVGPSWTQAEQLRQVVVRKNALLGNGGRAGVTKEVEALEKEIAGLRVPVARRYELRRVAEGSSTQAK